MNYFINVRQDVLITMSKLYAKLFKIVKYIKISPDLIVFRKF